MQRNSSMWVYFLSLLLGVTMTVALLPACGSNNDGGDTCNSPENQAPGNEDACDDEELAEEDLEAALEDTFMDREVTGDPETELVNEFIACGQVLGCLEL